jgi:hypothetical protein
MYADTRLHNQKRQTCAGRKLDREEEKIDEHNSEKSNIGTLITRDRAIYKRYEKTVRVQPAAR